MLTSLPSSSAIASKMTYTITKATLNKSQIFQLMCGSFLANRTTLVDKVEHRGSDISRIAVMHQRMTLDVGNALH